MICKFCKRDSEVIARSKYTDLVTLNCGHSLMSANETFPLPEVKHGSVRAVHNDWVSEDNDCISLPNTQNDYIGKGPINLSSLVEGSPDSIKDDILYEHKLSHSIVNSAPPSPFDIFKESFHAVDKFGNKIQPFPYQFEGIGFSVASGLRVLIADEPGLGKTIQAIGLIKFCTELEPTLILVKSSLKLQWFGEILKWLGVSHIAQIIETGKDIPVPGFKVYIATYDILRKFSRVEKVKFITLKGNELMIDKKTNPFYDFGFSSVILDECQTIKSQLSARTAEVKKICENKKYIIGLSGTPIKNHGGEYFTILNILRPDLFPSYDVFTSEWLVTEQDTWYNKNLVKGSIKNPVAFKEATKSFIIRRERKEVLKDLPTLNRVFHHVDFEDENLKKEYLKEENRIINEKVDSINDSMPEEILGIIAKLRHIVGVSKIPVIFERVQEFVEGTDRKLVVFTHHKDVLEMSYLKTLEWCLENGYDEPLKLDSSLSSDERHNVMLRFESNQHRILFASTLAAGEGLNMQFCSDCIIAERQWNPANEEQAEGRFLRIGQVNQVNATYLISSGTIEEWFTELVEKKRAGMAAAMNGQIINWTEQSLMKELFRVINDKGRKNTMRMW